MVFREENFMSTVSQSALIKNEFLLQRYVLNKNKIKQKQ